MKKRLAFILSLSMAITSLHLPVIAAQTGEEAIAEVAEQTPEEPETEISADTEDGSEEELIEETAEVSLGEAEESVVLDIDEDADPEAAEEETLAEEPEQEAEVLGEDPAGSTDGEQDANADFKTAVYVFPYKNNFGILNGNEKDVYVAVMSDDAFRTGYGNTVSGDRIEAKGYDVFEKYRSSDGSEKEMQYGKGYYVLASLSANVVLSDENLCSDDDGTFLFQTDAGDAVNVKSPEDAAKLKDGSEIGFSAQVQKNNTVKLKWLGAAGGKKYKTFQLFRLIAGGKWEQLSDASGKKAYNVNVAEFQQYAKGYTEVYKLACDDGSGSTDEYVTVAAPMIYYVGSYEIKDALQLYFTKLCPGEYLNYVIEVADDKAFTKAVSDNMTSENLETVKYGMKKLQAEAVDGIFYREDKPLREGNTYYCRVRGAVTLGGKTFLGAPGQARVVKMGPEECFFYGIVGITPEGEFLNGEGYYNATPAEGYIVFSGTEPRNVAGYELLACDRPYGEYKVVKKFPASAAKVYAPSQIMGEADEMSYYSIKYEGLSPEQKYYSLRAVSKIKKSPSGFVMGTPCHSELPMVEGAEVTNNGSDSITLSFKSQKGVNEYWIYRDTVSANLSDDTKGLSDSQMVGKIKNKFKKQTSPQTITYTDKKGVQDGIVYYYRIRPIFTKAYAEKQKWYTEIVGDDPDAYEIVGGYGRTLSNTVSGKATMENVKVGNIRAEVTSVKTVKLTWSSVKGAKKFYILRAQVKNGDWISNAELVTTIEKGDSDFSSRKYTCTVPLPGKDYVYGVSVGGDNTASDYWTITDPIATYPVLPTKLSTDYNTYGNKGAKLTWTNPKADADYAGSIRYVIEYRDNGGSWKVLDDNVSATRTSYKDSDVKLRRGVEREYRMYAVYRFGDYRVYSKKRTSVVRYCKPYRIAITNGSAESLASVALNAGSTYTFRVYFYDERGNKDTVTDLKLDRAKTNDPSICEVSNTGRSDNYMTVKVTAKAKGQTKLTVYARDYDDDTSHLQKTINITVRE